MHEHDVILVGGGGAGLRAAIAVAEAAPELSVAVVSKVYPMRSHTVSAEGGSAAVIKDNDSLDHHAYDTISGADWLVDQDAVEAFVNEAPAELTRLEHWGCPWSREPSGKVAVRPFGGMKIERTWFAADKTGFHMLHTLFQTSLKYRAVTRYDEHTVTDLIVEDGVCKGVVAIDIPSGEVVAIKAKAVIMTAGGAGRVFPFTTNAAIKTGDGMAIAYRAGVPLKDMEFVQYHPTGLPGTGILITEASRGEGGIMVNKHGRRYLEDYDLGKPLPVTDPGHPQKRAMELGPRDKLSQAFYHEHKKGNTIDTEYGPVVHLDVRHLGEAHINKKIPFVRELCLKYVGIDPVHEFIPVRPVVHYMMGGIDTDIDAKTPMDGLWAAGEVACVSINGANRLGSNSLTELLVFGARAGKGAAAWAKKQKEYVGDQVASEAVEKRRKELAGFYEGDRTEKIAAIRNELHDTMEDGAGIYRTEESLRKSAEKVTELRGRFSKVKVEDKSKTFNSEIVAALELGYLLDCASALCRSALARTESRGSHQRTDFPERDDEKFLKHSLAYYQGDEPPKIEYRDVVITRWPPGARTYGAASGLTKDKMVDKDAKKGEASPAGSAPNESKPTEKAET